MLCKVHTTNEPWRSESFVFEGGLTVDRYRAHGNNFKVAKKGINFWKLGICYNYRFGDRWMTHLVWEETVYLLGSAVGYHDFILHSYYIQTALGIR